MLRVFGGAGIEQPASPDYVLTTNCTSHAQVHTGGATQEGRGYMFHPETGAPWQQLKFATVAWTDGKGGAGLSAVNATFE